MSRWDRATEEGHTAIRALLLKTIRTKWHLVQSTEVACERCRYRRAVRLDGPPEEVRCVCRVCAEDAVLDRRIVRQQQQRAAMRDRVTG